MNQLTDTFDNYLAAVSAYQYLFDFGRTRGLVEQRDAEADAEAARSRLVELDLVFQVSQAYFDLVAAKEIVTVFEQAVAQRDGAPARGAGEVAGWPQAGDRRLHRAVRPGARPAPARRRAQRGRHGEGGARQRDGTRGPGAGVHPERAAFPRAHHRDRGALSRARPRAASRSEDAGRRGAGGGRGDQAVSERLPAEGRRRRRLQRARPGRDPGQQLLRRPGRHVADLQRLPHRPPGGGGQAEARTPSSTGSRTCASRSCSR